MFVSTLPILLIVASFCHVATSAVCSFENELTSMKWKVKEGRVEIHFQHNNLTENRWTSIAFGNGPGMNNLETVIFSRDDSGSVTTSTGYTPKKKKVVIDDTSYVTVQNLQMNENKFQVTISRPLGPAGPRKYSLDRCINWIIVPGGSLKEHGHFKKHHGGMFFIKNVCAAECTAVRKMLLTNRVE